MDLGRGTTPFRLRSKHTAYGISNCKSQIAKLKSEIWNLRFQAKRGLAHCPRSDLSACPHRQRGLLLGHSSKNNAG